MQNNLKIFFFFQINPDKLRRKFSKAGFGLQLENTNRRKSGHLSAENEDCKEEKAKDHTWTSLVWF